MSEVTTNKITSALTRDRGQASDFGTVGITHQPVVQNPLKGVANALGDAMKMHYAEQRREQLVAERERKASANQMGKYLAATAQDLPEDAEPETVATYNTSKFITSTDLAVKEIAKSFNDDSFQQLGVLKQNEIIAGFKENLANEAAASGVDTEEVAQNYVVAQMRTLDTNLAISRDVYNNDTIPKRTISTHVDTLITASSDKDTWSNAFSNFRSEKVKGSMDESTLNKVIYGESLRAIEAGNTEVYEAVKSDESYSKMTSAQKQQLDTTLHKTQAAQRTASISQFVTTSKERMKQAMNTMDLSAYEEVVDDIHKLPATIREDVAEKMAGTLDKFIPVQEALTKLDLVKAGRRDVTLSDSEASTVLKYTTMQAVARTATVDAQGGTAVPSMSTQEATQAAAEILSTKGIFANESTDAYNLQNPTFVDGAPSGSFIQSLAGADNLSQSGVKAYAMKRIMGEDNYGVYEQLNTYRDRGLDDTTAISRIVANREVFENSSEVQKVKKQLEEIGTIDQAGFFENMADLVTDFDPISGTMDMWSNVLSTPVDRDSNEEIELYSRVYLDGDNEYGSGLTDGAVDTLSARNQTELAVDFLAFRDKYKEHDKETVLRMYQDRVEDEAVVINGSAIMNDNLRKKLTRVSENPRIANKRMSRAMQVLAPISYLPDDTQRVIQDYILDVAENGVITTDPTKRRAAVQGSKDFTVGVNRKRYEELYANGGSIGGVKIPALRKYTEDLAGVYDTRKGDTFIQHVTAYDEILGGFVVELIDRSGSALTADKDFVDTEFGGISKVNPMTTGDPLGGVIPESLVLLYAESFNSNTRLEDVE